MIELPVAVSLLLAFGAGWLFCLAVVVAVLAGKHKPHPKRRMYFMEIVRVGRRRAFALVVDPPLAVLDQQDAPLTVESSDPAVVEATLLPFVEGEPRKVQIRTLAPGLASVTAKADADLDPGEVRQIVAQLDFEVTEAGIEAQSIALQGEGTWEDDTPPEAAPTV